MNEEVCVTSRFTRPFGIFDLIINLTKRYNSFPGDNSGLEPPDPISNSEVKRTCADDSVRSPHVKVGHRQGFIK